jgi:rhodanese-related sulfurtransferase
MNRTYFILAVIALVVAGGLIILPETERNSDIKPELLHKEINDPSRFLSTDLVTKRLINEDPSILLVDVRTPEQYKSYTIPGAINIPLNEINLDEWTDYFAQDDMDVVFFSNGDVYADQAWILSRRKGYDHLYVMSGGLNKWFKDIMQASSPPETAPSEDFDLYAFRMGAKIHFGGGKTEIEMSQTEAEPVPLIRRKKKTITEGGC